MKQQHKIVLTCLLGLCTIVESQAKDFQRSLTEKITATASGDKVYMNFDKKGVYSIYQGESLSSINWDSLIKTGKVDQVELDKTYTRPYFAVVDSKADTTYVSLRKIPFEKVHNFRDIGGIVTKDNRVVNWGRFYRADALARVDDKEFEAFNNLGITKVYDLRSDHEVSQAPNNLPSGVNNIAFPIFNQVNAEYFKDMERKFKTGDFTVDDADQILVDTNKDFASIYKERFAELMELILQDDTPIVYHCSAGKDRTGFTTALILSVLNVDRQTILDEYEMTNYYTQDSMDENIEKMASLATGGNTLDKEALRSLMGVKRLFLQAAFDTIDQNYGSMDNFIKQELNISDAQRKELIQKYTYAL